MTAQAILAMLITLALGLLLGFRIGAAYTIVKMYRAMDEVEKKYHEHR